MPQETPECEGLGVKAYLQEETLISLPWFGWEYWEKSFCLKISGKGYDMNKFGIKLWNALLKTEV